MNEQYAVWQKIIDFEFPMGFEERLAKEQGWTIRFTEDAMNEYLKFMFLSKFAGHKVTPSTVIDEVWHLHLIYSESYWDVLCGKILDHKLHHVPGNGYGDEDIFRGQYELTLKSYKIAFGDPDEKYWPKPVKKVQPEKKRGFLESIFSPVKKKEDTSKAGSSCGTSHAVDAGGGFWSGIFGSSDSGGSTHSHGSFGGGSFGGSGAGADWGSGETVEEIPLVETAVEVHVVEVHAAAADVVVIRI